MLSQFHNLLTAGFLCLMAATAGVAQNAVKTLSTSLNIFAKVAADEKPLTYQEAVKAAKANKLRGIVICSNCSPEVVSSRKDEAKRLNMAFVVAEPSDTRFISGTHRYTFVTPGDDSSAYHKHFNDGQPVYTMPDPISNGGCPDGKCPNQQRYFRWNW